MCSICTLISVRERTYINIIIQIYSIKRTDFEEFQLQMIQLFFNVLTLVSPKVEKVQLRVLWTHDIILTHALIEALHIILYSSLDNVLTVQFPSCCIPFVLSNIV